MEKALKAERIYNWGVYGLLFFCVGAMVVFMSEGFAHSVNRFGYTVLLICCVHIASHGVIKEFKAEIERLKSGGSANTPDPTSPADECFKCLIT